MDRLTNYSTAFILLWSVFFNLILRLLGGFVGSFITVEQMALQIEFFLMSLILAYSMHSL
jgi:hypothetical protein